MQWNSVSDFLNMGGYAVYVWGSFGVSAVALFGEMWLIARLRRSTLAQLRREFAEEGNTP